MCVLILKVTVLLCIKKKTCKSDDYQEKSEVIRRLIVSKMLFLLKILISTDVNCQVIHESVNV